ncbi:AAA family ATPase [Nocardiopsis sp. RV163]|uniref:AAA family ATPase n=1 Tax=Nocardiopsis sp. RV163 TaxID=1661388 RepID=UPI00064BC06B|nr:AAA family ATPase [Nocardiopsis sp. RV163]
MIKRVLSVHDFRCFQRWNQRGKTVDFQRLNLVYAPNGTGKSTFAELLSGVPGDKSWSHGTRTRIQPGDDPSDIEEINGPGHRFWDDVRLFNAEYVRKNLRFDAGDGDTSGADAPALLHMGEKNVERQERKERAEQEIERLRPLLRDLRRERDSALKEAGNLCTKLGRRVNNTLRGKALRFNKQFDKRNVEKALAEPPPARSELRNAHERDQALLNTSSSEQVPPVDLGSLPVEDLLSTTAHLLERTVTSDVLSALKERPDHETWVRQGLGLHADRHTCVFCGGEVSARRRAELDRHFDEGYTRLLKEVDESLGRVRRLRSRVERLPAELPHRALLFEDLKEDYGEATKLVEASINAYLAVLDRIAEALEQKKEGMFTELTLPCDLTPVRIDTTTVNEIIGEHNERTERLDSDRAEAAEREFQRMLEEIREPWARQRNKHTELSERVREAEGELEAHLDTVRQTPEEGLDPRYLVSTLNRDVNSLLRRADLTFVYRDDRYHLLRHSTPARHLSEGEKTAIAMVYFLVSLKEQDQDPGRAIVVVDDPVSSMDEQLMTGVQSMLVGQLDPLNPQPGCRQLFVLTHNAAFLRMWTKELTRGRGNPRKSLPPTATLHIMKSVRLGPTSEPGSRRPELAHVDLASKSITALDTEYNLLFYRVAHDLLEANHSVAVEADLRLITDSSNSTRRLLEHFLGFMRPNQAGKFTNVVEHALKQERVRANRITALLNGNSHHAPDPEGKEPMSDEARGTITDVFRLMNELHPEHFDGMCERLGISEHKSSLLCD